MARLKSKGSTTRALTLEQSMALVIGDDLAAVFGSEEAARVAWFANRDQLIADTNPLGRPMAWWWFEAPEPCPPWDGEQQHQVLERLGVLSPAEKALLAQCRKQAPGLWK